MFDEAEEITDNEFVASNEAPGNPEIDDEVEIIEISSRNSKEFKVMSSNTVLECNVKERIQNLASMIDQNLECIFWPSILSASESCRDFDALFTIVMELKEIIPPLKPRKPAFFCPITDTLDCVAQSEIPKDGPTHLKVVATKGDGNCLTRSVSKGYWNTDVHHVEVRARMVMEGVINMKHYISDECLERGATFIHQNADLPTVFTTFSDFYTPGQKITKEMIAAIYCLEVYSCA